MSHKRRLPLRRIRGDDWAAHQTTWTRPRRRDQHCHGVYADDGRESERLAAVLLGGPAPEQLPCELPLLEHELAELLHTATRPSLESHQVAVP